MRELSSLSIIMVSERGQLASRRQIQGPRGQPGWLEFINHMPVIANPADPSYCNSGRDGVEHCTPAWYREGPEATWLAEGTLASQLEKKGTRLGKGSSSSIQIVAIGGPLRQSKVPTKSSSAGPRTRVGGGDGAAGCRARRHVAARASASLLRLSCCLLFLWPSAPDRAVGGGRWGGKIYRGRAQSSVSPTEAPARVSIEFLSKRCMGGSCPACLSVCVERTVRSEASSAKRNFVWYVFFLFFCPPPKKNQTTTKGGSPIGPICLSVCITVRRWRRQGPVSSHAEHDQTRRDVV